MDPKEYKQLHESYMMNNNGTSGIEVLATIAPSFFFPFLLVTLMTAVQTEIQVPVRFLIEFFTLVWTIILNVTVLNARIFEITGTLLFVAASVVAKNVFNRTHVLPFVNRIPAKRPEFIVCLRATVNLITAVCILAVDFKAFPRKLAKTETYGFGLMDTGVGLYVFSNALVDVLQNKNLTEPLTTARLYKLLGSTAPLLILGMARFFVINELDYQQHTSEYGVHWNFFITLAVTKLLGTIVLSLLPSLKYCKVAVVLIVAGHQVTLLLGLARWVTSTEVTRETLLTANREGMVSIPGYVGLYLACIYLGSLLIHHEDANSDAPDSDTIASSPEICTAAQLLRRTLVVGIHALVTTKVAYDCQRTFGVSRRLADMSYILWIFAIASTMTTLFMLLEVFYHFLVFQRSRTTVAEDACRVRETDSEISRYSPLVLSAINYNGLAFFLLANVMTGMVNMTFQTLLVDTAGCVFIVSSYMFVLCAIVTFLYVNQIRVKY